METQRKIHTELGFLPKLISLPVSPEAVRWQEPEYDASRPDAQSLIVRLKLSEQDLEEVLARSKPLSGPATSQYPSSFFNEWVPEELKVKLKKNAGVENIEGEEIYILQDVQRYYPDIFTQTDSSPFIHGDFTNLGGGYLLLDLFTM